MDVREKLLELVNDVLMYLPWGEIQKDTAERIVDRMLDHGVTVQEWISVDDRLPDSFESVLVFRDGKITIDHHEENGWFAYDFKGKRATHWMPIPQPTKGE